MKLRIKKIFGLLPFTLFLAAQPALSENIPVNAYFFYGDGCPHCAQESRDLSNILKREYPGLRIYEYEIYSNRENAVILQKISEKLGVEAYGVPFLIIGDKHFIGYADGITLKMIEQRVNECTIKKCPDSAASLVGIKVPEIGQETPKTSEEPGNSQKQDADSRQEIDNMQAVADKENEIIVRLPFIGEIDALSLSLPILTMLMGALDGFNPCAMWTLLFLISLLLGMENRKKMWLLGTVFIVASASVYFLFMSAWLNLILFLGFVIWIRILIGILALIGGGYNIKEFIFNKESGCKTADNEKRKKIFEKLKLAVQQNSLWLSLGGIAILAFAVNLVELICSAGLPAVYTQVLSLSRLAGWQYYLYILLYVFFFMLDDLFIFFATMITMEMTGITTKYTRLSRLIGGLIMLAIGLMLIFNPEWLMFG